MGKLHDALRKAEADRSRSTSAVAVAPAPAPPARPEPPKATPRESTAGSGAASSGTATPPVAVAAPEPVAAPAPVPIYIPAAMRSDVDPHLVPVADPHSPLSEQYRALRTNLLALAGPAKWKVFVVTSSVPGEGKSVSSANLACTLAEQPDRKVVLVDADMRKATQHKLFAVDNQRGLSDYLAGGSMLEMSLQRSRLANLWVLPAGRAPANPAELLSGKRMEDLLARLRRDYDFVVIDTPPVVSTTDAAVLSPRADGTLLVIRMGVTQRDVVKHAAELLKKSRANVVGTVLTGLQGAVKDYFYYPYHGNTGGPG